MKDYIKIEDLHFVGSFRGRNLYLETPDHGIVEMFNDFLENLETINRLHQEIKTNQEMSKITKLFSL